MERGTVIQISDRFKATWDGSNNWELEEFATVKPVGRHKHMGLRESWRTVGYFGKVKAMLAHIIKYRLVASEIEGQEVDLREVLNAVENAHERFKKVLAHYE